MYLSRFLPVLSEMTPQDFVFDYEARVPAVSFVTIIIGLILLSVPAIWLFIRIGRRFRLEAMGFAVGMGAGMLSMILFPIFITFLFEKVTSLNDTINANLTVRAVVYSLLTVIPVYAVIFFGLKLCIRKAKSVFASSVLFGVGLGVIPVLTSGIPSLMSYLSAAMNINQGQMEGLISTIIEQGTAAEDIQAGLNSMTEFITTSPLMFLTEPAGLVFQMAFYIGVCILTGGFLSGKAPSASLLKALCLEALCGLVLIIQQLNDSTVLAICLNFGIAAASLALAYLDLRAYLHDDWKRFLGKPDPTVHMTEEEKKEPQKKRMPKIVMPKD